VEEVYNVKTFGTTRSNPVGGERRGVMQDNKNAKNGEIDDKSDCSHAASST
jgi:hypothetical protein